MGAGGFGGTMAGGSGVAPGGYGGYTPDAPATSGALAGGLGGGDVMGMLGSGGGQDIMAMIPQLMRLANLGGGRRRHRHRD
jgi:hypothetical protein